MKKFSSLFVLVTALQITSTSAQAANQGNLFSCEGKDFVVNYSSSSLTGDPHYSVKDSDHNVEFNLLSRKEIKSSVSPMGTLITATYFKKALADGPTYLYSLVIPAHELGMAESLKLETLMIRTTVVSPFHPQGMTMQTQHSVAVPMTCEVQRVIF